MGLHDDLMREPVSALPLRPAITMRRGTPARLAVAEMKKTGLGAVILVDDHDQPTGIFTERVLVRMLAKDPAQFDQPIEDHAIPVKPLIIRHDEPVIKAIEAMQATEVRFFCVVDEGNNVVSLGGLRALLEYVIDHFPRAVKVQELEAKLYMDEREGA